VLVLAGEQHPEAEGYQQGEDYPSDQGVHRAASLAAWRSRSARRRPFSAALRQRVEQ
jgi:hypothetical protein